MFGGFYGNRIFRRIHLFISSTIDHSQHQSNFFKNFMIFPKKILQNYCFYEIYILFSIFIINASLRKIWNFFEHIIFVSYAIGNHERPRLRGNNFFFSIWVKEWSWVIFHVILWEEPPYRMYAIQLTVWNIRIKRIDNIVSQSSKNTCVYYANGIQWSCACS